MKMTIESTSKIVTAFTPGLSAGVECRVWEGVTEHAVRVVCLIPRIAVAADQDTSQFEKELKEVRPPSPDLDIFPLRMVL